MGSYDRKDPVYRMARSAGLRSRAGVKLEELDRRFKLLSPGKRVLDLGAWPGGWLQVAAKGVGDRGVVVGVDLQPIEPLGSDVVRTIVGDILDANVRERIAQELGGPADVVLSDMAPKLSGVKVADRARHLELIEAAVSCADAVLGPRGKLVVKLFSGIEAEAIRLLRARYGTVTRYKPGSTRKGSAEMYAVAAEPRPTAGAG